jgi:hypothetical protein
LILAVFAGISAASILAGFYFGYVRYRRRVDWEVVDLV